MSKRKLGKLPTQYGVLWTRFQPIRIYDICQDNPYVYMTYVKTTHTYIWHMSRQPIHIYMTYVKTTHTYIWHMSRQPIRIYDICQDNPYIYMTYVKTPLEVAYSVWSTVQRLGRTVASSLQNATRVMTMFSTAALEMLITYLDIFWQHTLLSNI